jgi:4-hydroxybenzoate polyprenyltransferase
VFQFSIGYLGYIVFLFIVTGLALVFIEVKSYTKAKMNKEGKISKRVGWLNILMGLCIWIGYWFYSNFY